MPKEVITQRSVDYNQWYLDIVREADLAEVAEVVRGCIVVKAHGWAIWELMQRALDDRIKQPVMPTCSSLCSSPRALL